MNIYFGNNKYIDFDRERAKKFIDEFHKAVSENRVTFLFMETAVSVSYASFIVDFISDRFPNLKS